MKSFNRTYLPEVINYNGKEYKYNALISGIRCARIKSLHTIESALIIAGKKAIEVKVLSRNLKGRTDLYGNPYEPTTHIFTTI